MIFWLISGVIGYAIMPFFAVTAIFMVVLNAKLADIVKGIVSKVGTGHALILDESIFWFRWVLKDATDPRPGPDTPTAPGTRRTHALTRAARSFVRQAAIAHAAADEVLPVFHVCRLLELYILRLAVRQPLVCLHRLVLRQVLGAAMVVDNHLQYRHLSAPGVRYVPRVLAGRADGQQFEGPHDAQQVCQKAAQGGG